MKRSRQFLQSIFPLPRPLQELIQAEAFLLISSTPQISKHLTPTFIRCIQYSTQKQARQNQIKYISLSNSFHLQIKSSKLKHIENSQTWCLIIEMQQPKMTLRQKINMNKKASKKLTQNEIIMIVNCMNILYNKYSVQLESRKITVNQLFDNIFVSQNQLIKLSVPSLACPLQEKVENKLLSSNINLLKFSIVLIEILTLQENSSIQQIVILKRQIESLRFGTFCLRQLKNNLLDKLSLCYKKSTINKSSYLNDKKSTLINQVDQQESFPKRKFTKKSKQNKQIVPITINELQSQKTTLDQLSTFSNNLSLNFKTTLNEMADNKFAQSFQQDQYSYILQSQNTSPLRVSPHRGYTQSEIETSSTRDLQQQQQQQQPLYHHHHNGKLSSFQPQVSSPLQLQTQPDHLNPPTSNYNSIIFEVEQQSNYELVETESMFSQQIELSFSREKDDDQIRFGDVKVQQIVNEMDGTMYYGEVKNGVREGRGKLCYQDGGYYQGNWRAGAITGFGRLFYPSGKLAYAGYWHSGSFHGPGLVLNESIQQMPTNDQKPFDYTNLQNLGLTWVSYRGNFNMDVRKGFGMVKLQNGDSISGMWQDNCLNGQGEYRGKNGLVIRGIWKMNKLVNVQSQEGK